MVKLIKVFIKFVIKLSSGFKYLYEDTNAFLLLQSSFINPLSAKKSKVKVKVKVKKSKVKVALCHAVPYQFQSLVVSLSDIVQNVFLCCIYTTCGT